MRTACRRAPSDRSDLHNLLTLFGIFWGQIASTDHGCTGRPEAQRKVGRRPAFFLFPGPFFFSQTVACGCQGVSDTVQAPISKKASASAEIFGFHTGKQPVMRDQNRAPSLCRRAQNVGVQSIAAHGDA